MAELTITPSLVVPGTGAQFQRYNAGAVVTAGQSAYLDGSNLWQLADANASVVTAAASGIVSHAAAVGQPTTVQTGGLITVGATLVKGTWYVVGATPGSIAPIADITTGWWPFYLGYAISTTQLQLTPINSGVQL